MELLSWIGQQVTCRLFYNISSVVTWIDDYATFYNISSDMIIEYMACKV